MLSSYQRYAVYRISDRKTYLAFEEDFHILCFIRSCDCVMYGFCVGYFFILEIRYTMLWMFGLRSCHLIACYTMLQFAACFVSHHNPLSHVSLFSCVVRQTCSFNIVETKNQNHEAWQEPKKETFQNEIKPIA